MKSFEYIDNKKVKLNIYGNGDLKSEVIKSQENDSRIQYCGVVNNEKMRQIQKESDILINPRQIDNIISRYTFPSKTFEYFLSQVLVISTKIPSYPDEYLDKYPIQMSGGQQQRVGVARAFASEPDIILMDEPFSALDPITRNQLQDELLALQNNLQKTIVFVTHDMAEAIKLADRICIMNDGKIQQFDTPEQILKHPANDFVLNFVGKKRIWDSPELIKAKDIMIDEPIVCPYTLKCIKALNIMFNYRVDSLMVVDKKHTFMGMVYADQVADESNKGKRVDEIMQKDCVTAQSDDSIVDILNIARQKNKYTIPVVDDGHLVGLITKSTLVTTLSKKYDESEGE